MEPRPPFHHHHRHHHHHLHNDNRYAPIAPPPPPHALRFSDDRNFYHQHLPPPPQLPTPPPPPPSRPPPPSYHHHPPQFPFPVEENPRRHGFDVEHPSRVSDRYHHHHHHPFPEDHPRLHNNPDFRKNSCVEGHPDVWDPPRVPANNRPIHLDVWDHPPRVPDNDRRFRPFPIDWDDEPHHRRDRHHRDHPFNHPMSPFREAPDGNIVDWKRLGEEREGSSFREYSREGFDRNQKEELFWDQRDHRGSSGDRKYLSRHVLIDPNVSQSGNLALMSVPTGSRNVFGSNKGQPSRNDGEEPVNRDRRWNSPRSSSREVGSFAHKQQPVSHHSAIGTENEEMGSDIWVSEDGRQVFTGKHFHHLPKYTGKQFQHQSKYGKFKNIVGDEGSEEFIHTPNKKQPRMSALLRVQLGKTTPRKWKDEESLSSGYFDEPNASSLRGRGPLVFSDTGTEEDREGNPVELDVSFKSNALVAKAIMASSIPGVGSDGMCTPNFKKKRDVMAPVSSLSTSQVPEIHAGLRNGDSSKRDPDAASCSSKGLIQSEDKVTVAGIGTVVDVGSQPCLNGRNESLKNSAVVESPSTLSTMVGSDRMRTPKIKKKKKKITAPVSGLSCSPVTKVHEGGVANRNSSAHGGGAASSSVNGVTQLKENRAVAESPSSPVVGSEGICTPKVKKRAVMAPRSGLSNSTTNEIRKGHVNSDVSTHRVDVASSSPKGLTRLEEKRVVLGSLSSPMVGSDGKCNPKVKKKRNSMTSPGLSRINRILKGHVNADSATNGVNAASSSNSGLMQSKNEVKVFGFGMINDIGFQPLHGVTKSLENSPAVESLPSPVVCSDNTPKIKKKKRVTGSYSGFSSSRAIEIHKGPVNADSSTPGAGGPFTYDKGLAQSEEKVITSVSGTMNDPGSQTSGGVTALPESSAVDKSHLSPVIESDGTLTPRIKKKRKIISCSPGLSTSQVANIYEGPINADGCNYGTDAPSNSDEVLMRSEEKGMVSGIGTMDGVSVRPLHRLPILFEKCLEAGSPMVMVPERDGLNEEDVTNSTHLNVGSSSLIEESTALGVHSFSPSGLEGGQKEDVIPVVTSCPQYLIPDDITELENGGKEGQSMVNAAEELGIDRGYCEDFALHSLMQQKLDFSTLELHTSVLDERSTSKAMEVDSYNLMITNSNEEGMESVPDRDTINDSEESLPIVPEVQTLNSERSHCDISSKKGCRDGNRRVEKPMGRHGSFLNDNNSFASDVEDNMKLDQTMKSENSIPRMTLPSQETKLPAPVLKLKGGKPVGGKTHQVPPIAMVLPGRASFASGSLKEKASSSHVARRRTWHRTDNASNLPQQESCLSAVSSRRQSPRKFGKLQGASYIRKGNSLVRKCAPIAAFPQESHGPSSSVYRLNPTGVDESKRSGGSESKVNNIDPLERLRTGTERPKTPPLPDKTKLPDCTTKCSLDHASSTLAGPPSEGGSEITPDSTKLTGSKNAPKDSGTSENQAGANMKSETRDIFNHGKSKSSKTNSIMYVKRKSNQLVASHSPEICDPSVNIAENTQAVPSFTRSDHYFKRNKNQLIRNVPSSGSHLKQAVAIPDDGSNSEGQRAPKVSYMKIGRYLSKRRTDKVSVKTRKPSKFSLVWTLKGTQSQNENTNSLQRQKVFPYLFPWKRMAYYNSTPVSNKNSFSLISRKLLFSRKRDAVYIRSTGGFSLRKSKVLSIGGSNLKWSKSIERRSKKANEEATLAVAAVQRKRREQKGAACAVASAKNRNHSSRERIFRIGSVRYKMDSSKRTLQRIPDEKSSCTVDLQSGMDSKKYLIPKRLLIGNDEYIRIGNGNQLVRDPKKLVRILASEKIRWSLHTARLRLARKQQYCQFFTRFGKCNKDGGKCPYIHDPAKIAVCTKFLKGLCSNTYCKLTHKVIPERMPDCSYFLQGLCTNENCPYRHVNVNPNASVCEGFLRGYCVDGDECCKKHSYVCPLFEATGLCPQGSMCKLHHPKNRSKTRKRKRTKDPNKTKERYFGSGLIDASKTGTVASDKHTEQKNGDILFQEERFSDYISLDVGDYISLDVSDGEEAQDTNSPMDAHTNLWDSDPSDLQSDYLDELIKPIRIMNKTTS